MYWFFINTCKSSVVNDDLSFRCGLLLFATTMSVVEVAKRANRTHRFRDIDPLVISHSGVWCKRTGVSHFVVKLHILYRCRLVRLTPTACSPAIDGRVLTVAVRECIVVFGSVFVVGLIIDSCLQRKITTQWSPRSDEGSVLHT